MECNKDEAVRAKELAEKRLTEKDIAGAKRFAAKAQSLFPGLDGLPQLQEILDVYVASQKKVNGEIDWYGIFGVDPLADDETIRKKYRKLALALHPDKNKSVGADGAFKIISEAWSLLSDKAKRDAYNEKRNIRASYQRPRGGNPPAGAGKSTCKDFTSSPGKPRTQRDEYKWQPDIKSSYKKARGKNQPVSAGKSSRTNFNNSSSTINPSKQDRPQQDTRYSHQNSRGGNPPVSAGKSSYANFAGSSPSRINPATPDNPRQDTKVSYQKARDGDVKHPAAGRKSDSKFCSTSKSGTGNPATSEYPQTVPVPPRAKSNTFWTLCKTCRMQYEYVCIYRNQKLLCPNCRKPFLAREMPPPQQMGHKSSTKRDFKRKQQVANNHFSNSSLDSGRKNVGTNEYSGFNSMGSADISQGSSYKCSGARSESTSVMAANQPAQNFQSTDKDSKRGHEEGISGAVNKETLWKKSAVSANAGSGIGSNFEKGERAVKKRRMDEHNSYVQEKGLAKQIGPLGGDKGNGGLTGRQMDGSCREKVSVSGSEMHELFRNSSQSETFDMLMLKAKMEICQRISESGMSAEVNSSGEAYCEVEREMPNINATEESVASDMKKEENSNATFEDVNCSGQLKNSFLSSGATNSDTKAAKILATTAPLSDEYKESSLCAAFIGSDRNLATNMTMIVPDSDFIDFDKDRAEGSFAENEVWAAYDDKDGMPRLYALVHGVTSNHPSKVKISWLYSIPNTELGTLSWVHFGFSKACGDFKISRREIYKAVNCFSHRVKSAKFSRGFIQIFPRKGDVWALYRHWSFNWNELTPDDVIQKYDMVEVIEDYDEEYGVRVAPLVKVAEFKSIFHQHLDTRKIYTIPREEMFRFSHQVPACLLSGHASEKEPRGCWELDPAAMPEELLLVIRGAGEEEVQSMSKVGEVGRWTKAGED